MGFFFNLFIFFCLHFLTDSDTKHIFITFNYLNEHFIDDKTDIIHHSAQGQLYNISCFSTLDCSYHLQSNNAAMYMCLIYLCLLPIAKIDSKLNG